MLALRRAVPGQRLSVYFREDELACRCCKMVLVHPGLLRGLEGLRHLAGAPALVLSGYRCAGHNRAVGGVENSYHIFGMAADIRVPGMSVQELASLAERTGFDGIGQYPGQNFVHVDVRGCRSRWKG